LYLKKQRELQLGRVSTVEIDLLRAGQRLLPFAPELLPASYRTPYQVWVRRGWRPTAVAVYRVALRERLPTIAVPLRRSDEDVPLNLQALIELCYHNGSYEDDLDYQTDPDPPLPAADARWAAVLLRKRGLPPRRKRGRGEGQS
jgi:hypothetical protein